MHVFPFTAKELKLQSHTTVAQRTDHFLYAFSVILWSVQDILKLLQLEGIILPTHRIIQCVQSTYFLKDVFHALTQAYSEKEKLSSPNRSQTYDLAIRTSDDLPLSYRRRVVASLLHILKIVHKLNHCDGLASCTKVIK